MNFLVEFEEAFNSLKKEFPIKNYVGKSSYYAVQAIMQELVRLLPSFKGKRMLDVGCGPMDKTAFFQLLGLECCAADDLSDPWHKRGENTKLIKEFAARMGINFFHQSKNDYSIPFQKESFDVVSALDVIEHLHESPRDLLNTLGGYLKPNGLLVITMPNSVNLRKRLSVLIGRTNYVPVDQFFYSPTVWRGHVREYTLSEVEFICRKSGFEILTSTTFEQNAQEKLSNPFLQLYLVAASIIPSMKSGLLVVCRKPPNWEPLDVDVDAFRRATEVSVPKGVA